MPINLRAQSKVRPLGLMPATCVGPAQAVLGREHRSGPPRQLCICRASASGRVGPAAPGKAGTAPLLHQPCSSASKNWTRKHSQCNPNLDELQGSSCGTSLVCRKCVIKHSCSILRLSSASGEACAFLPALHHRAGKLLLGGAGVGEGKGKQGRERV